LTILTLPARSSWIFSRCGTMALHGAHQVAQKSTMTGVDAPSTSLSKLASEVELSVSAMRVPRVDYRTRAGRGATPRTSLLGTTVVNFVRATARFPTGARSRAADLPASEAGRPRPTGPALRWLSRGCQAHHLVQVRRRDPPPH